MITSQKLKILVCSEASFLNTGFANYSRELLQRLYHSNKYDIAEFASYSTVDDPRRKSIPWRFYANAVNSNDLRYDDYSKSTENQFGKWRFEKVLLDFKPNVVIDTRDYWMHHYQSISPLRDFFHWIVMPTVDSYPQQESWIETYISADAVFTYSDWGAKVLNHQSNCNINYIDTVSPSVDLDVFKYLEPNDRKKHREQFNIDNHFIVGSVMRNQKRKLIPELMSVFKKFITHLEKTNHPQKDSCYLWLHTGYPDAGWDLPLLLKDLNIFDKILFTYYCDTCKSIIPCNFIGVKNKCSVCNNHTLSMPSVIRGPTPSQMSDIYNCFDIYIQYAICEGFGMPQVEAGACGNPIATVNYSAMKDIIEKLDAFKIRVKQKFRELETKAIRVYPNNNDLFKILMSHINTATKQRNNLRKKTRDLVVKHYNWSDVYKKWESYLDTLDPNSCSKRHWDDPAAFLNPLPEDIIEQNIDPSQNLNVVTNACLNHLKDITFLCSMSTLDMLSCADYGFAQSGLTIEKYSINNILRIIQSRINNHNAAEKARVSGKKIAEDFILQAIPQ